MPELPEVETVVRELRPRLVGRRITRVEASSLPLRQPWSTAWNRVVTGRRVAELSRRGKWIIIQLDRAMHLVIHLGMTGQLTVVAARTPRLPHTHLVFDLDGGGRQLRFRDVRRFGSATLYPNAAELKQSFDENGLGPEPFEVSSKYWCDRLASTQRCLKAILLDQRVVAGVGNIYADESLFEARLHPARLGSELEARSAQRLRRAIETVLRRAIDKRGSSIRDYVGGSGVKGDYQREFRVYGRTGEPCVRCKTPIARFVLAGRSTHVCPRCQPEPR
jgi:formamidopyrimidine-DNA glycosylase